MLEKESKIVWIVSLFLISEAMAYWGYWDLFHSNGHSISRVFGAGLFPFMAGGILAFIYSAINKFNKEKASSVYCVWTVGVVVLSIMSWPR
jgi:peptidoglycan/LPS O-acetylase OafA/YrhL